MGYPMAICGRSYEDFLNTIECFHGWKAPGVVIGGFMVDLAQEHIGPDVEADAIVGYLQLVYAVGSEVRPPPGSVVEAYRGGGQGDPLLRSRTGCPVPRETQEGRD